MRTKSPELVDNILDYYNSYYAKNLCAPSFSNVAKETGMAKATIVKYVKFMEEQGMLEQSPGNRGYIPANVNIALTRQIPQVGYVSCGAPMFAEENIERYIPVMINELQRKKDYFYLIASGDSMVDAGISNGDLVLIRKEEEAAEGDIIVALTEDGETTLKRLFLDRLHGKVILHPENKNYDDIYCDGIKIQGVVETVTKRI